ncbi:phosphoribosyltransferase [Devosia sp. CN2-171]|uniref:phosphoribosyltransferase n=1 Tax=Devosia sp. CN2-171 TaxID=3400909 RepID=UPI003BF7877E
MQPYQFWQELQPASALDLDPPFASAYPATLPDGRLLLLPIRPLPDGQSALCSLTINQASFAVLDTLADHLAAKLAGHSPDVVVGLPTLGLTLAAAVAMRLGHSRYVPLGTSRKFWYEPRLSVPMSSVTTPDEKRLYLDPRLLPLLQGKRVALVDDVISTGRSITAGLELLAIAGVEPVVIGAAMLQSDRWREAAALARREHQLVIVIRSPRLRRQDDGWVPE